jgi:hypothetical protein
MGLGKAGKESAPIVFAGYGITNEKAHYDDYEGLDVAEKIVVVLRGSPKTADRELSQKLFVGAPFSAKLANAEKHKAVALLVVNDRETARGGDDLLDFNFTALDRRGGPLPAFHLRRDVLQVMLGSRGEDLDDIEGALDRDLKPQGRSLAGWTAAFDLKMHRAALTLKNVVGVLEGAGPLAKETVVVGAHYDHLGYGNGGGSRAGLKKMAIHHGADDNGSGTTAILALARRFGEQRDRQGRRLVFIAFSGEELGLFGSEYYCKKPLFPLKDTAAMYNLDMVGRLRPDEKTGKDKLLTEGSGTARPFVDLLDRLGVKYDLTMVNKPSGFGPSDHASFCDAKVPVLFVWTGYHDDYHMPADTADKINVAGMRKIVDLSVEAITTLATMERPAYVEIKRPRSPSGNGPRLGIRPDYADAGDGVLLGGVAEGGAADRAGLKKDDRIVEMAGKPVKDLETYMEILHGQKKGDTIEVVVVRNGKKLPVKVKLD